MTSVIIRNLTATFSLPPIEIQNALDGISRYSDIDNEVKFNNMIHHRIMEFLKDFKLPLAQAVPITLNIADIFVLPDIYNIYHMTYDHGKLTVVYDKIIQIPTGAI